MSSNKLLFSIFFIVIIGLIGGIGYMYSHPQKSPQSQLSNLSQQPSPTNALGYPSQQPSQTNSQNDSTDQQLINDAQRIDDSLNALTSEVNTVDQGLNDQQTSLQ